VIVKFTSQISLWQFVAVGESVSGTASAPEDRSELLRILV
jgi:hypothetical protein